MPHTQTDSINNIVVSVTTPMSRSWKLLYDLYRVEANTSITISHFLHHDFQRQLLCIENECKQGYNALTNIRSELEIIKKCNKVDKTNLEEIKTSLGHLLSLFGSSNYQELKLASLANYYKDMVKYQKEKAEYDSKIINRTASVALTTAGIGFAGFAAVIGASANVLLDNNLKSKLLLGATGGSLVVASISQIAEYFGYDNFQSILNDLSRLRKSLSDFFGYVHMFGIQLTKLIQEIESYSREIKRNVLFLVNHQSSDTLLFSKRIGEMIDKTLECQINIAKLEVHTKENYDSIKKKRKELPIR